MVSKRLAPQARELGIADVVFHFVESLATRMVGQDRFPAEVYVPEISKATLRYLGLPEGS